MTLPIALKRFRDTMGISQAKASAIAGVSTTQYQNYEYGKSEPTIGVLVSLAEHFNVSLDYLTGRTDNPEINR